MLSEVTWFHALKIGLGSSPYSLKELVGPELSVALFWATKADINSLFAVVIAVVPLDSGLVAGPPALEVLSTADAAGHSLITAADAHIVAPFATLMVRVGWHPP